MGRLKSALEAAIALTLTLAAPALAAPRPSETRPNIIVILADDLGYGDLGVQGGRDVRTPNIDRLARDGVRLTDFYANAATCAPSRAALMTGRYQQRFGFENNPGAAQRADTTFGLPTDRLILPERLKTRGYATGMFGKWHLGFTPTNTPAARGFDTFYGFLDGAMAYTPGGSSGSKSLMRGMSPAPMPAHTTEAFTDEAVSFIEANKDRPFFVYAAYNAVHAPLQTTPAYLARVAGAADPRRQSYLAMLAALDDGVGKIVDAVDRNGLAKNTLIVFTSDNGGPTWQTTASNGPLNGVKALALEGGIRVPAIVRWTGTAPAGRTLGTPAMGFDITTTALSASGAPPDADLDGVDLTPFLRGSRTGDAHRALFWRSASQGAMRQGRWKLLKVEDAYYLFDLQRDIGERNELAARTPKRLAAMKAEWNAWSDHMAPARWGPLSRSGSASPGELKALVEAYVKGLPADPRSLLYGGGPE